MVRVFLLPETNRGEGGMFILEIKKSKKLKGQYFFRIKGSNGKIVANSEAYRRRSYCVRIVHKISTTTNWKIRE